MANNFATLSFIPAIPTRSPDHSGSRFDVWFDEKIIRHNKSKTVAQYVLGSSLKGAYIKGAPSKGTLVSDYFTSETLMERILANAKGEEYEDTASTTNPEPEMVTNSPIEEECGFILINGEQHKVFINMDKFKEAMDSVLSYCDRW